MSTRPVDANIIRIPDLDGDGVEGTRGDYDLLMQDPMAAERYKDKKFDIAGTKYSFAELMSKKNEFVAKLAEPKAQSLTAEALKDLSAKIAKSDSELTRLKGELDKIKGNTAAENAKREEIKTKLAAEQQLQRQNLKKYDAHNTATKTKGDVAQEVYARAGVPVPKSLDQAKKASGSLSMPGGQAKAQTVGGDGAAAGQAKAATGGGWGSFPSNWGAQTASGPQFSSAAYAQSLFMEGNMTAAWDGINSNKNRGQQLMQLLYYFQRMAMSGDLGAMYNMMKCVLYIISKDKALQQINMSNLLIEFQDKSRKATDKLVNYKSDANDPNSQTEFTKVLQANKQETDSIATSQKLIAQMMEEMAQIVETLTNVTKGALDAHGRVMRTVARFG